MVLVMTEVLNADGTPHESNARLELVMIMISGLVLNRVFYNGCRDSAAFRLPMGGYPGPQITIIVQLVKIHGRSFVEEHVIFVLKQE